MRLLSKLIALVLLAFAVPVWAQQVPGVLKSTGAKLTITPKSGGYSARLDGKPEKPVHVVFPGQLDVQATVLAFDFAKDKDAIEEVRARQNSVIKLDLKPKNGVGETVHIESKSDDATLTTASRTLVLTGNLSGFYRIGNEPPTLLSGDKATFNFAGGNLNALIESGGSGQVELLLPAETNKPDALGPVTLRADSLRIDQKDGAAYFTGNARAFSTSGTGKLDVKAPSFTILRAADGTIGTLTTNGVTVTKLDLPPDASGDSTKPTHIEVTADKAIVNRAASSGVFDGNVKGFYRLQNAPNPFNFAGDRATVNYDAQAAAAGDGLSVVVTGAPVDVEVPAFNLNF